MAAGAGFWNFMAKNYSKSKIADEESYQAKLEKTRAYFRPEMDVLEIGCGTGSTAILHAPFVRSYEGVDFSKKMLGFADEKREASGLTNLKFTCRPIDEVSRAPESFDMVLAMSVLHLLPTHKEVLAQIFDLLKPEGLLISSTACIGEMGGIVKHLLPVGKALGVLPPVQNFSRAYLEQQVVDTGFVLEEIWQPRRGAAVYIAARKPA